MRENGATSIARGQAPFGHLLASKPPRERSATAAATTASLLFHGALIAAAVVATTMAARHDALPEERIQELVLLTVEPRRPPLPPIDEPAAPRETREPRRRPLLENPAVVPVTISPADSVATREEDNDGIGMPGGVAGGDPVGAVDAEGTYLMAQVSRLPRMLEVVKPRYPDSLRRREVQGTVVLQAVVLPNGKVEAGSVKVIRSLHEDLDAAAVKALQASEFSPALYGEKPVRVMLQVPYTFTFR